MSTIGVDSTDNVEIEVGMSTFELDSIDNIKMEVVSTFVLCSLDNRR